MENFKAQQILNLSFLFQMDRSSSLLRVRSSDWYQTKALDLYFHTGKLVFVFRKISLSKLRQHQLTLDRISDQFWHVILSQMRDCWPDGGKNHELSKIGDTIFYQAQLNSWSPSSPNTKSVLLIMRFLGLGYTPSNFSFDKKQQIIEVGSRYSDM